MKQEKCLIAEAMDKCQCEICKSCRKLRYFCIKMTMEEKAQRIYLDALKESKIIKS